MSNQNQMIQQLTRETNTRYAHARAQPLYSTISLAGFANADGTINPQRLSFFQAKENSVGQGFGNKTLHRGLTNFTGAPGTMPTDQKYVAMAAGVRFLTPPGIVVPRQVLLALTNGTASISVRRGDSTSYSLGALEHLPSGRFGLTSRSVAALGEAPANGDMTLIDYPTNGDAGLKLFPAGSELHFERGQMIEVNLEIHETLTLTDTGEPIDMQLPEEDRKALLRDCYIQMIFDGFSLSGVQG